MWSNSPGCNSLSVNWHWVGVGTFLSMQCCWETHISTTEGCIMSRCSTFRTVIDCHNVPQYMGLLWKWYCGVTVAIKVADRIIEGGEVDGVGAATPHLAPWVDAPDWHAHIWHVNHFCHYSHHLCHLEQIIIICRLIWPKSISTSFDKLCLFQSHIWWVRMGGGGRVQLGDDQRK